MTDLTQPLQSLEGRAVVTMLTIAFASVLALGCERELSGMPPPLRPLVYTEAIDEDVEEPEPSNETMYVAPEDLGVAIFQSLVEHDRALYERVFVTGGELVALIHADEQRAERDASTFLAESELAWSLFLPATASEEPVRGLSSRLRLLEFKVGKGRDLSGNATRPGDEPKMHLECMLRMELRGTDKVFSLRVPKIVKTTHGWKVMGKLNIDSDRTLRMYLEAGMHLKPELLLSEHYPFPYEVGNFWKYRVTWQGQRPPRPEPEPTPEELEAEERLEDAELGEAIEEDLPAVVEETLPLPDPTLRISVTEILRRQGYLIATLEEEFVDATTEVDTYRLLVTPRRVFRCTRDCYANIDDIGYLLGYMQKQTPYFVFPLEPEISWGKAGRRSDRDPYAVEAELSDASVPAGDFVDAFVIAGSIEEGREERYFVPGTGIVKRIVRSGLGPRTESLIEYRLML